MLRLSPFRALAAVLPGGFASTVDPSPPGRAGASAGGDLAPVWRWLLGGAALALSLVLGLGAVRWLAGWAPPTPWVRSTALAIHLATVLPAVPLGAWVLLSKKGGPRHRALGKLWLVLMLVTASATLFIRNINPGGFSAVHLFTALTFLAIPKAIRTARSGDIAGHRRHMAGFYAGALLAAGLVSLTPGRTMWQWAFGDPAEAQAVPAAHRLTAPPPAA